MNADVGVRVTVAPGNGRIARRAGVVLFDPTGDNADLIAAFGDAVSDDDAVAEVKVQLVTSEFSLAPLALISWQPDEVDLMVFGDVSLHSSVPSSPMITGAGSASWVERRISEAEFADMTDVAVWCGDDVDDATNLQLGVVRCAGMRLVLDRTSLVGEGEQPGFVAEASQLTPDLSSEAAEPEEAGAEAVEDEEPELDLLPEPPEPPVAASSAAIFGGAARPTSESPAPDVPPMPPPPAPDRPPMPAPPAPAVALDSNQDDFTDGGGIVPDSPAVDDSPVVDNPATPKEGLVEAVVCSLGHENAPHSGTCSSCGTAIPTDAPSVLVEQPTIGKLVFLDGQSVPVNGQLVLGRRPTIEPGQGLCIAIDQAEVSRSHATITVDGWSAYVTDLGSRNGTFVVAPDNPSPVKLDAHAQHFLEPGTTIHLGGSEASFTYLGNDD